MAAETVRRPPPGRRRRLRRPPARIRTAGRRRVRHEVSAWTDPTPAIALGTEAPWLPKRGRFVNQTKISPRPPPSSAVGSEPTVPESVCEEPTQHGDRRLAAHDVGLAGQLFK